MSDFELEAQHYDRCREILRGVIADLHSFEKTPLSDEYLAGLRSRAKLAVERFVKESDGDVKRAQDKSDAQHASRGLVNSTLSTNMHRAIEREAHRRIQIVQEELDRVVEMIAVREARSAPTVRQ